MSCASERNAYLNVLYTRLPERSTQRGATHQTSSAVCETKTALMQQNLRTQSLVFAENREPYSVGFHRAHSQLHWPSRLRPSQDSKPLVDTVRSAEAPYTPVCTPFSALGCHGGNRRLKELETIGDAGQPGKECSSSRTKLAIDVLLMRSSAERLLSPNRWLARSPPHPQLLVLQQRSSSKTRARLRRIADVPAPSPTMVNRRQRSPSRNPS